MRVLFLAGLLMIGWVAKAQNDSTARQGEILTGEVVIEKNKEITLPKADKLYQRASLRSFETDPLTIILEVFEPALNWPPYKTDVPFIAFSQPYPTSEYPNYVKLGYGNFNSPLLEAGVFHKIGSVDTRSKVFYESFKRGPINGSNSGNSEGIVDISASYRKRNFLISPYVLFRNQQYSFYGNTDRDNTPFNSEAPKVSWNSFNGGFAIKGSSNDIQYQIKSNFSRSNQKLKDGDDLNKESVLGINGQLDYKIDTAFSTGFDIEGYSGSYDGSVSYDRLLFLLNPWVSYRKEALALKAGFRVASGKTGTVKQSGFYPEIKGEWSFSKEWSIYGTFSGGVKWNGLNDFLSMNEFLDDSLTILNTETTSEFGGGIKGSPYKSMIIDASLIISNLDNLPLFVSSESDSSRYIATYDNRSINRVSLNAELTFTPTNVSTYGASLQINGYSTESQDRAWHLPTFVFQAFTSHNINEKLIASATVLTMSGIKAPSNVNFGISSLDSFIDLGLGMKYLITNRASAFIEVDNLLNNEYERYIGYPVRGLTFKIGGQYRF